MSKMFVLLLLLIVFSFGKSCDYTDNKNIDAVLIQIDVNESIKNLPSVQQNMEKYQASTKFLLKRAEKTRDSLALIQDILKQHNIPLYFSLIPYAESNFKPKARGFGTLGLWQLTKSSAKSLGLKVTKKADERTDIQKSTKAAIKHLLKLKQKYNSWYLADFAYGMGESKLDSMIKSTPDKTFTGLWEHAKFTQGTKAHFVKIVMLQCALYGDKDYSIQDDLTQNGIGSVIQLFNEPPEADFTTINQSDCLL